jgi:arylsulfatase A-like enzyme
MPVIVTTRIINAARDTTSAHHSGIRRSAGALGVALLVAVILSAALLIVPGRATAAETGKRPNILFIFTDDHAFQAISAYGSKINQTPNMDRLARDGMLFRNCYVTNSICGPSRATILTGKYSHLNGFYRNGNRFDGTQQTFPKLLQKAGYQTAIVGKWHLASQPTGFDYHEVLIGQGPYYNPPMIRNGQRVNHEGYTTEIITDLTLDWLKEARDPDKPFMLMCQHKAPHRNWQPGPGYLTMYDDVTIPEPKTLFDDYSGRGTAAKTQDMTIEKTLTPFDLKLTPPRNLTPEQLEAWEAAYEPKNEAFRKAKLEGKDLVRWKYQRYIKDYLRCVAAVDDNIGRVLDYLDASGLAENTVVVYSSDQGFYLGEHGWFDKRWMYKESLGTPLIVRWPGVVQPGSENDDIVSNLDFAETFLDMAGAEVPQDMQGHSLVPLLKGNTSSDWRKSFYYHYYEFPAVHSVRRHYGVATDRYKLIHFYKLNEWELYDLAEDPNEMKSVYNDPSQAEVIKRLKTELVRLRALYDVPEDSFPLKPPGKK